MPDVNGGIVGQMLQYNVLKTLLFGKKEEIHAPKYCSLIDFLDTVQIRYYLGAPPGT